MKQPMVKRSRTKFPQFEGAVRVHPLMHQMCRIYRDFKHFAGAKTIHFAVAIKLSSIMRAKLLSIMRAEAPALRRD